MFQKMFQNVKKEEFGNKLRAVPYSKVGGVLSMGMARAQEPVTSRDRVDLHMVREQKAVLYASRWPGVYKTHLEDCKTTT